MDTGFMTRPEQKRAQDKAMDAFAYHQLVAHVDNVQPPVLQPRDSHPFRSPVTIPALSAGVCSNAVERQCIYFEGPEPCQDLAEVWRRLEQFCRQCEIRECKNEDCKARKARLRLVAPKGGCEEYREWRTSVAFRHLANAALDCVRVIGSCANNSRRIEYHVKDEAAIPMMLAEVCNQVYWMISVQADYGIAPRELGSLGQEFMPSVAYTAVLERARGRLTRQKLCKKHVWNLVQSSERKEAELLDLSESIRPLARKFKMKGHELCAWSKCQLAHRNSTNTTQLHKCSTRHTCGEINLPMQLIGDAVEQGHPTAWRPDGKGLCKESEGYIAISHVWSDGTGAGGKRPGTVSTCLFDFFRNTATNPMASGGIPSASRPRARPAIAPWSACTPTTAMRSTRWSTTITCSTSNGQTMGAPPSASRSRWEEATRRALNEAAERFSNDELASPQWCDAAGEMLGTEWNTDNPTEKGNYRKPFVLEGIHMAARIRREACVPGRLVVREGV
ncbi:uncharacterized protein BJX67DRAFT_376414 [Aspergillus lucknowensis]|uniref:Uncharacterized protein n=1 Tax=Aspergillus lucknowensis TaxID=176173 RepID=A0ABR4M7N3_9EURO